MRKIILACAGNVFPDSAFEFAAHLNDVSRILLTGVFLQEIIYPGGFGYTGTGVMEMPALLSYLDEDRAALQRNMERFSQLCEKKGIEHRIHEGADDFSLPQLKKETRFADALIISNDAFFNTGDEQEISDYLKVTLRRSECPVLIVPGKFEFPDNILLAYDGSESSVHAIKMFAYLFPELCTRTTSLVYFDQEKDEEAGVPDQSFIAELGPRHFSDFTIVNIELGCNKSLDEWLENRKNTIIVMGAFERSVVSEFFNKSFAEEFIRGNKFPIFIAHK